MRISQQYTTDSEPNRFSLLENMHLLDSVDITTFSKNKNDDRKSQYSPKRDSLIFRNTAMQKIGNSLESTLRTDCGFAFSKAKDRF